MSLHRFNLIASKPLTLKKGKNNKKSTAIPQCHSNRIPLCFDAYSALAEGWSECPRFLWWSVNVRPCRAESSFAYLTRAKWEAEASDFQQGKAPAVKLWKCIFPSWILQYRRPKNALKSALFSFRTVSKLILLPYKATDLLWTIDILLIEVNLTHARTKTMHVIVSLCAYWVDFMNFLPWSCVVLIYFCPVTGNTPVSL